MPQTGPFSLLSQQRFLPYFITQFLGAFNDNIFKNVLLLFVAFASVQALPVSSNLFINLAAGLFILPFFLFSATAGVLADKYEKSWFIRKVKLFEVVIMSLGAIGFIYQSYTILLVLLFLMGTQSAFFGPVKYALLPQQLSKEELVTGNALVEMGTFLAILLGTLGAGLITSSESAKLIAAGSVVIFALLGYFASCYIPQMPASNPNIKFKWQPIKLTKQTLAITKQDPQVFLAVIAISWFWLLGAAYLTQFANFTKINLFAAEGAVAFLLGLFSVGIAVGSLLCDKLSKKNIELGLVPIGALGISVFGLLMPLSIPDNLTATTTFYAFLSTTSLWPLFSYLLLIGIGGGLFIVPLYAQVQHLAKNDQRAQVIAGLNIYNALFMVASAVLGIICLSIFNLSIPQFFIGLAVLNLFVALYLLYRWPIHVVRFVFWVVTHTLYRVKHNNLHHLPKEGGALIVCNHISYMDALLVTAVNPRLIRFVMEEDYANLPPIRGFLKRAGVIPISAERGGSIRRAFVAVEQALQNGEIVCIFPEGQLTSDGNVAEFMRGIDIILKRSPVPVIPMALNGLWGSYFSRFNGRACKGLPRRFWSKLDVSAGEPVPAGQATSTIMRERVIQLLH